MELKPFAVVFDFDKTLATRHLWYVTQGGHPTESRIDATRWPALERADVLEHRDFLVDDVFGGAERLRMLDAFMQEMRDRGGELYVSSLNYLTTVQRALEHVGLLHHFVALNARDTFYVSLEYWVATGDRHYGAMGKENYLVEFVTPRYHCTVFIDDQMSRIRQSQLIGARNLKQLDVHGAHGVDQVDLERIRDALRLCGLSGLHCSVCRMSQALYYYEAGDCAVCHRDDCARRAEDRVAYAAARKARENKG